MSALISYRALDISTSNSHSLLFAVLIELTHTEEAVVSRRFPVVIPFLGVTSYLVGIVELKSYERIDNLMDMKQVKLCNRTHRNCNLTLKGEAALASRKYATS